MKAWSAALAPLGFLAACGGFGSPKAPEATSLRATGVGANADPTVRPARLVPETVDTTQSYGTEASGGTRTLTSGLRVVSFPKGAVTVADDRLPQPPQMTVALPERLGGGFLFILGTAVWRADQWLGAAKPIFTAPQAVQAIVPGLDRVYLRTQNTYLAIDGKTGRALDLGPMPASPFVASFAAADGWRAAAVTDLRGVVVTFDAGATWRPLDARLEPKQVLASGDSLAVEGVSGGKAAWFEVRADGSVARLGGPPREAQAKATPTARPAPWASARSPVPAPTADSDDADDQAQDVGLRIFGGRPLVAAIEDGWPLSDGTALVARDGALGRVRLSDGMLIEIAPGAFQEKPARCHAVSLARPRAPGAFGFVCGEPRGKSVIYAYEPTTGKLASLKHFDKPRVVMTSGNGALAVRGACAEDADSTVLPRRDAKDTTEIHPYCVFGRDDTWRDIHVRGDGSAERVVVLSDGKIVVVSPPLTQAAPARLTILDQGKATTVPIVFPKVAADVGRVLRLGLWLDGFEERRPGVVGGWLEAGGVMLGIEVALDGNAKVGQFIRDAGLPFVSGRYGFGWGGTRRGYETIDGGMTWSIQDVPDPLVPINRVDRRAAGPVGAMAAGWLRVGWGESKKQEPPAAPPLYRPTSPISVPDVSLSCEPMAPPPPTPQVPRPRPSEAPPVVRRAPFGGPPVLSTGFGFTGTSELPPFYSQSAPSLHDTERGVSFDVQEPAERYPRLGLLSRIYAWGPKGGDWDTLGKWQVRWLSPFSGWPDARASAPVVPPQALVETARMTSMYGGYSGVSGSMSNWQLASGDDPSHAMLIGLRLQRQENVLFELEAEHAPVEVRRADGEPLTGVEGIVRASGSWYVSAPSTHTSSAPATVVWQIEGGVARELAYVPRSLEGSGRSVTSHLARRSDGRAIGLVVDGQPTAERATPVRWVLPIALDTGQAGEPETLGYVDLAGRTLEGCSDDFVGWVLDTSLPSVPVRLRLTQGAGSLHSVHVRARLSPGRACLERVAGLYDGQTPDRVAQLSRVGMRSGPPRSGDVIVSAFAAQSRFPLRCTMQR